MTDIDKLFENKEEKPNTLKIVLGGGFIIGIMLGLFYVLSDFNDKTGFEQKDHEMANMLNQYENSKINQYDVSARTNNGELIHCYFRCLSVDTDLYTPSIIKSCVIGTVCNYTSDSIYKYSNSVATEIETNMQKRLSNDIKLVSFNIEFSDRIEKR